MNRYDSWINDEGVNFITYEKTEKTRFNPAKATTVGEN